MNRIVSLVVLTLAALSAAACDKPVEKEADPVAAPPESVVVIQVDGMLRPPSGKI